MTLTLPVLSRINDYLDLYAHTTPEASACWFDETFTSYAELAQRVDALARAFVGLGLRQGDRVPQPALHLARIGLRDIGCQAAGAAFTHRL